MLVSAGLGYASSHVSTNKSIWVGPKGLFILLRCSDDTGYVAGYIVLLPPETLWRRSTCTAKKF